MPIYFNSSPVNFPFQFDSIGNNWDQEPTLRPDGFPLYHYLQTQEGCGILTIDGRDYTIEENQGVLLAPGVSHAYRSASGKWITLFATFSGSMSPYFSTLFGSSHLLFFEAEKAAILRKLIDQAVLHQWSSNQPFPAAGLGKIYPAGSCYYTYQVYGGSHCRSAQPGSFYHTAVPVTTFFQIFGMFCL